MCKQYLTKGQQVYVEGRPQSRTWQGQDGEQRFANSINLTDVKFLGRPQDNQETPQESEPEEEIIDLPV